MASSGRYKHCGHKELCVCVSQTMLLKGSLVKCCPFSTFCLLPFSLSLSLSVSCLSRCLRSGPVSIKINHNHSFARASFHAGRRHRRSCPLQQVSKQSQQQLKQVTIIYCQQAAKMVDQFNYKLLHWFDLVPMKCAIFDLFRYLFIHSFWKAYTLWAKYFFKV